MTDIDTDAIRQTWLNQCGPCDAGLPMPCSHPQEDYRPVMSALLAKVGELTAALAEVREQLTAANRRADGLEADLRSAVKGNTEYSGQVEQLKRAIREALNGVSHVWDAQRIDWVPIAEYAAKKPAEATR